MNNMELRPGVEREGGKLKIQEQMQKDSKPDGEFQSCKCASRWQVSKK